MIVISVSISLGNYQDSLLYETLLCIWWGKIDKTRICVCHTLRCHCYSPAIFILPRWTSVISQHTPWQWWIQKSPQPKRAQPTACWSARSRPYPPRLLRLETKTRFFTQLRSSPVTWFAHVLCTHATRCNIFEKCCYTEGAVQLNGRRSRWNGASRSYCIIFCRVGSHFGRSPVHQTVL